MPWVWTDPDILCVVGDVTVYCTYRHDMGDGKTLFWYSTDIGDLNWHDPVGDAQFDVRDLSGYTGTDRDEHRKIIIQAIQDGKLPLNQGE